MQFKSFVFGTVCGLAFSGAAFLLWQSKQEVSDDVLPEVRSTSVTPTQDQIAPRVEPRTESQPETTIEQEARTVVTAGDSDTPTTSSSDDALTTGDTAAASLEPIPTTDAHRQLFEQMAHPDPAATDPSDVHRELENEPRDHDWSYFMEQSIAQYLASHPDISAFDVVGIVCRSTICQIQSFAVDQRAAQRWSLILHDLQDQPWSDFSNWGASSSLIEERLVLVTHLYREVDEQP